MRSLLVIEPDGAEVWRGGPPARSSLPKKETPVHILECCGYTALHSEGLAKAKELIGRAEAVVLHLPLDAVRAAGARLAAEKALPLFWWCSAFSAAGSADYCEDDTPVDGLLASSMSGQELHWSLHFGWRRFIERQQWLSEKRQLESRLEERKWIDMAKGILCKIKSISEAEAYEVLRKQAMNERKRMVDVATSIVKVYQILQEQK